MTDRLVVDASALVLAVVDDTGIGHTARTALRAATTRHAPHLIDAEIGHVLRRMEHRNQLSSEAAAEARRLAERSIGHRHPHVGALSELAWELGARVSFYDALYVALATALDATLLTADARLASTLPANRVTLL